MIRLYLGQKQTFCGPAFGWGLALCKRNPSTSLDSVAYLAPAPCVGSKEEPDEKPMEAEDVKEEVAVEDKTEKEEEAEKVEAEEEKMLIPSKPSGKPISSFFGQCKGGVALLVCVNMCA